MNATLGSDSPWMIGKSQSPFLNTVGLLSKSPSEIRRGADHFASAFDDSAVVIAHTPPRPSQCPAACVQNSHRRPAGSCHKHGSNARTYEGGSITSFGSDHVFPSSRLVTSTT